MDSSENFYDDDDNGEYIPIEVMEAANIVPLNLLPAKSRKLYTQRYNQCKDWRKKKTSKIPSQKKFC